MAPATFYSVLDQIEPLVPETRGFCVVDLPLALSDGVRNLRAAGLKDSEGSSQALMTLPCPRDSGANWLQEEMQQAGSALGGLEAVGCHTCGL